ncbi:cyclin-domain-containing protein, partial [Rhodocollybia butyracea]
MLERLMSHNDQIPLQPESLTRFHSRSAPGISVLDYLKRIVKFTKVEIQKACLLITLHYIDQICARVPLFTLSSLTCHRFIITAITVSSKGLCDVFCNNTLYAKVGGISVGELNVLEREFLRMIEWTITCTREMLQEYYTNLVRTHSTGKYIIAGTQTSEGSSSGSSDFDMETLPSRSPSINEPSAILVDPAATDVAPRPTIEQNMAFAALQNEERESQIQPQG